MDLETLNHVRYPSFNNHYDNKTILWLEKQLENFDEKDRQFVATEKLHGSNFSIYTDGKDIKCARRNGFLEENENFHQAQNIAQNLKPKIVDLYNFVSEELLFNNTGIVDNTDFILILFGEVTGERVQLGISYGENAVRFFDICIYKEKSLKFLDYKHFVNVTSKFELETVPVIAEGKLHELLKLNPEFDSKILSKENNIAEGMVLKFCTEMEFEHGDVARLMLKFKCKKFDEIQNAPKGKKALTYDDSDLEFLSNEFETRLTFSRLQAVKSKLNSKQAKNRQVMAKEMYEDVLGDMVEDSREKLVDSEALVKKGTSLVNDFVGKNIRILNFSNDEYGIYMSKVSLIEKFSMAEFEEVKGGRVNVGSLKDAIQIFVDWKSISKNIQSSLMPVLMGKAKELVGI